LIYYEDLISFPEKSLKSILDFLEVDSCNLSDFMDDYELHKQKGVSYYEKFIERSVTKGSQKKLTHHSSLADKNDLKVIRQRLENKYKVLSGKYLKRYL